MSPSRETEEDSEFTEILRSLTFEFLSRLIGTISWHKSQRKWLFGPYFISWSSSTGPLRLADIRSSLRVIKLENMVVKDNLTKVHTGLKRVLFRQKGVKVILDQVKSK